MAHGPDAYDVVVVGAGISGLTSAYWLKKLVPDLRVLHPSYTSAPRMAAVATGTLALDRDGLHHNVFARNYNAAFVDRFVERLRSLRVEMRFRSEVRRIDADGHGERVEAIWVRSAGPETGRSSRYVCESCGAENWCVDRALCTRCGMDTNLDRLRSGENARPLRAHGPTPSAMGSSGSAAASS